MDEFDQDLEDQIDQMKAGLVAVTRGDQTNYDNEQYRATRKRFLGNPKMRELLPSWLRTSSTLVEANQIIRQEADQREGGKWANRSRMISEGLNPLIDELQIEQSDFAADGELGELLGRGGFGEVYRWRHRLLDMDFAVKILSPSFPEADGPYLERFFLEARILLSLNHPNIVRVFDVGMTARRAYIRMELLHGENLNTLLQRQGRMEPIDAATVALSIAEGLAHAHEKGVIHRDLKPSNVYCTDEGSVKLIDFGLGAFVEGDLISRITRTGEVAVGGLFTAPELVSNPKLLDRRSDLYSLGAVWFNTLTGMPPAGSSLGAQLDTISGVSLDYKAVVLQCLADIQGRYASASQLASDIGSLVDGEKARISRESLEANKKIHLNDSMRS